MDKAMAALDKKSQEMMATMISELTKVTIIRVAHRAELETYHSRTIRLERRKRGARLVSDIDLLPRKRNLIPCGQCREERK